MSQPESRKSSLGTNSRRGPHKAHIPYRGDDLEHGKKTGKTVTHVSRDADDFEPFEQVLDQAYKGGSVPRAANNRSRAVNGKSHRGSSPIPDEHDDSGELSMDLDSVNNSPSVYFNTATAPQPSSARRVGSSSRALPRGSTVDYDRVPSPKRVPGRHSVQPRPDSQPQYPSRLRNELQEDDETIRDIIADTDPFASAGVDPGQDYPDDDDDFPPDEEPSSNSRGNLSFTELAQDEDDEVPEDDQSFILPRTDKGKGRATVQEEPIEDEDDGIEDDIAAGLQDLEGERYDDNDDEEEEEEEPGPSSKKTRRDEDGAPSDSEPLRKPPKKSKPKQTNGKPRISMYETLNEDGLRRSKRRHYPPLEYWRQERVVWGRREKGHTAVPVIKEIITIPKPEPEPLGAKKRKRGGTRAPRSKSKSAVSPGPQNDVQVVEVDNPELGWDDGTAAIGVVVDCYSKAEVERRVAFTARMAEPRTAMNDEYKFQKIFGDDDFIAAGQLVIPPGGQKPQKYSKDNTYIFYVIQGAVRVKVHRSSFIVATGGMFLVPRSNPYYIENICQREVKLFFAQARKISEGEMNGAQPRMSAPPRGRTAPRSSSHGAPSPKQPASAANEVARGRSHGE